MERIAEIREILAAYWRFYDKGSSEARTGYERSAQDLAEKINEAAGKEVITKWNVNRIRVGANVTLEHVACLAVLQGQTATMLFAALAGIAAGLERKRHEAQSAHAASPVPAPAPILPIRRPPTPTPLPSRPPAVEIYRVAAGRGVEAITDTGEIYELPTDVKLKGALSDHYALLIVGDSMAGDDIHDGDVILVRHQKVYGSTEPTVVYDKQSREVTLKRVSRRGDTFTLRSSNKAVAPFTLPAADVEIQGRFVMVLSRKKTR